MLNDPIDHISQEDLPEEDLRNSDKPFPLEELNGKSNKETLWNHISQEDLYEGNEFSSRA